MVPLRRNKTGMHQVRPIKINNSLGNYTRLDTYTWRAAFGGTVRTCWERVLGQNRIVLSGNIQDLIYSVPDYILLRAATFNWCLLATDSPQDKSVFKAER